MSPTHNKTSQRRHIKLAGRKKNENQQENTRPPPIFRCHACSSLMSQVWWINILSVHFFKWFLSAAWRKAFEESTTLRGLLPLPDSAAECSTKAWCLCLQMRLIQKSFRPDMKRSLNISVCSPLWVKNKSFTGVILQSPAECSKKNEKVLWKGQMLHNLPFPVSACQKHVITPVVTSFSCFYQREVFTTKWFHYIFWIEKCSICWFWRAVYL